MLGAARARGLPMVLLKRKLARERAFEWRLQRLCESDWRLLSRRHKQLIQTNHMCVVGRMDVFINNACHSCSRRCLVVMQEHEPSMQLAIRMHSHVAT
jgi:hypothetical protein